MLQKKILIYFFGLFLSIPVFCQDIWNDTTIKTVDLSSFKLSKKLVRIEYNQVTAYVNQKDYFGNLQKKDTVLITPKYLDEWKFISLLEKGKVKLFRLATDSFVTTIRYWFKRIADILQFFEFEDKTVFFVQVRAHISLFNNGFTFSKDTISKDSLRQIIKKKDFAYTEEFPDKGKLQSFPIQSYFPLHKNSGFVFYDGNRYGETDSILCKSTLLQQKKVYYFAASWDILDVYSIDNCSIGEGLFFYRGDSLFTIPANYEKDIKESDTADAKLFLPAMMQIGDSCSRENDWNRKQITLLKQEDLKIEDRIYTDCLKFKQLTYWDDTVYLSYFWLQKNTGLVKWMRDTGREDILRDKFRR